MQRKFPIDLGYSENFYRIIVLENRIPLMKKI